ncbi:hypothetical protein KGQ29_04155 [Patescibacteria group bacterium]|nr:hypothetical protein [Patescibacteria group bacterium]
MKTSKKMTKKEMAARIGLWIPAVVGLLYNAVAKYPSILALISSVGGMIMIFNEVDF